MRKVILFDIIISFLLLKIEIIMNKELNKPTDKMDTELIELCVDILLKREK